MPEVAKKLLKTADERSGKNRVTFDWPLAMFVLIMVVFGLIMVFSASHASAYYYDGDGYKYIRKQAFFAVVGVAMMFVIAHLDYHILHKLSLFILVVCLFLLVVVLFMPPINFARRWINVFNLTTFQPSDMAKFAVIVFFAHIISVNQSKMKTFTYGVLPFVIVLGVISGLMLLEPHVSGTLIILAIGGIMMLIGGTGLVWFALAGGSAVAAVVGAVLLLSDRMNHVYERVAVWQDPFLDAQDTGYQTIQSMYAIGSGGLFGLGIGNSRQKHLYVSEAQNDFIFSIICEELGFIGAMVVVALFVALLLRGVYIAMHAKDKFGAMLVIGIITQISVQAALNIAVVTNTIPNTGISLPFFSYGGTSLVMLLCEIGVVLSVSAQADIPKT